MFSHWYFFDRRHTDKPNTLRNDFNTRKDFKHFTYFLKPLLTLRHVSDFLTLLSAKNHVSQQTKSSSEGQIFLSYARGTWLELLLFCISRSEMIAITKQTNHTSKINSGKAVKYQTLYKFTEKH